MSWKTVFEKYQSEEIEENGKYVKEVAQQVSQFSHLPYSAESQNNAYKEFEVDKLIGRLAIFYSYTQNDITEIKNLIKINPDGALDALRAQVEEIALLESVNLSWRDVPAEFSKSIDKLCEVRRYPNAEKEKMFLSMQFMSFAQMLREIKLLARAIKPQK